MSYSSPIENDEITCLTNLMSGMSEATDSVNVTEDTGFQRE